MDLDIQILVSLPPPAGRGRFTLLFGVPPSPSQNALRCFAEHACGVAFWLPDGRCSCTPRRKYHGKCRKKRKPISNLSDMGFS